MALDREREIGLGHAGAIVANADQAAAAAVSEHIDPARPGIERVFDKLLDHARRALDDLARRNAVDDRFGELADRHGDRREL